MIVILAFCLLHELGISPRIKLGNKSEIYSGIPNGRGENAQKIFLNGKPYMEQSRRQASALGQ